MGNAIINLVNSPPFYTTEITGMILPPSIVILNRGFCGDHELDATENKYHLIADIWKLDSTQGKNGVYETFKTLVLGETASYVSANMVVDGRSRRYAMVPAFGMVISPQNLSTGNGQVPGCSCILSVGVPVPVQAHKA